MAARWSGVERGDAGERFGSDRRALGLGFVEELAADVGKTGDFRDTADAVELFEPGITIGMHEPGIALQVPGRTDSLAVHAEPVEGGRRDIGAPGTFIPRIDPDPDGPCLAVPRREHIDRRVVGMDCGAGPDMRAERLGEGFEQRCGLADPVRQHSAVQIKTRTRQDLALAV